MPVCVSRGSFDSVNSTAQQLSSFCHCISTLPADITQQEHAERSGTCPPITRLARADKQNTASNLASGAVTTASNLAGSAATAVGLGHSHAEEHLHRSTVPPDTELEPVRKMDSEGLAVFEEEAVRHEVLVKINKLAVWVSLGSDTEARFSADLISEDARHGLKEVAAFDIVIEGQQKKGISVSRPALEGRGESED